MGVSALRIYNQAISSNADHASAAVAAGNPWQVCLEFIRESVNRPTFLVAFQDSTAVLHANQILMVHLATPYALELLRNPSRAEVTRAAREAVEAVYGADVRLEYTYTLGNEAVIVSEANSLPLTPAAALREATREGAKRKPSSPSQGARRASTRQTTDEVEQDTQLTTLRNNRWRFDTFVVGDSNHLAFKAARAVASSPATSYNPLLLYGNSGLGKTHLLRAIEFEVLSTRPRSKVVYTSFEAFTNEWLEAIELRKMAAFRRRYRNVDYLLLDDVQFLQGKKSTQQEFYHTFEDLMVRGCQIVLTSDRPPRLLTELEERLSSRLSSGLIADIQTPSAATALDIVKRLAHERDLALSGETVAFIAEYFRNNVRELEGAVNRLALACSEHGRVVELSETQRCLDVLRPDPSAGVLTLDRLLGTVCSYLTVTRDDLLGPRRDRQVAHARHVAMWLALRVVRMSCRDIAEAFGGRDYSSVKHAVAKIDAQQDLAATRRQLDDLTRLLSART